MKKGRFLLFLLLVLLSSCASKHKIVYMNNLDAEQLNKLNESYTSNYNLTIKRGDILIIAVSALDPEAVAAFNLPIVSYAEPGSDVVNVSPVMHHYIVSAEGTILFPVLGTLQVENMTTEEATKHIAGKLSAYVKDPIVSVRQLQKHITVLGEVNRPGVIRFNHNRLTLLDALGFAGDLTIYGKRENILVLRDQNGQMEMARINLTSADFMVSPFFYLQQNDVVYVEPNQNRVLGSQSINLYLSVLSTITTLSAVIFSFIK